MKNRSLPAVFFSICFIILISVPLVSSLLTRDEQISKSEKRRLTALPEFSFSKSFFQEFPVEFEKYYNDHFGFRNRIVRLHNYAVCSIFRVSPSDSVTVGRNNWYFFNVGALRDYFGLTQYKEQRLAKFGQVLEDRKTWLNSMGIHYLFLPVPNKSSIYGEYLPSRITKNAGRTKYEQITSYLKNRSHFDSWLNSSTILTKKKNDLQVYFRTDSHWNHDGVYFVYRGIIDRLAGWLPGISPLEMRKEKKWIENFSGDLSILMNLRGLITEKAPAKNFLPQCDPGNLTRLKWMLQWDQYEDVPRHRLPVENGCDDKQYTALVIHDSFGNFLRPLLSQHFKKIIYVHFFNFERIKPLIEREMVNVVIDERVSRNLQKALKFDEQLEQTVLKTKFSHLPGTLMEFNRNTCSTYTDSTLCIAGAETTESFSLNTKEGEHFLPLTFDEKEGDEPIVIQIDITSEQATALSVFYLTRGVDQFTDRRMETRHITAGRQNIYFRILPPETIGRIRIQPEAAGSYKIDSITVKREQTSTSTGEERSTGYEVTTASILATDSPVP